MTVQSCFGSVEALDVRYLWSTVVKLSCVVLETIAQSKLLHSSLGGIPQLTLLV